MQIFFTKSGDSKTGSFARRMVKEPPWNALEKLRPVADDLVCCIPILGADVYTPLKINILNPKNRGSDDFPFQACDFQVPCCFSRVYLQKIAIPRCAECIDYLPIHERWTKWLDEQGEMAVGKYSAIRDIDHVNVPLFLLLPEDGCRFSFVEVSHLFFSLLVWKKWLLEVDFECFLAYK